MMKYKLIDIRIITHYSCRAVLMAFILLVIGVNASYAQFPMGNTLAPLTGSLYPIVYANDAKGGITR